MTDRLHDQADAMARLAERQSSNADDYDRMALQYPYRAEHYRAAAARCRSDAAWYAQKAAERAEWADSPPETPEAMYARLGQILASNAREEAA